MKEKQRFYILGHGWATKYYWFNVIEEVTPKTPDFIEMIKNGKFTFSKQSGTIHADAHGSTLALTFYSEKLIQILKKESCKISVWKINFIPEFQKIGAYYYMEPKSDCIRIMRLHTSMESLSNMPTLLFYLNNNPQSKKSLFQIATSSLDSISCIYDFSSWDGSDIFGVKNTLNILVTEKIKKAIEREKLKNVLFEEIKPFDTDRWLSFLKERKQITNAEIYTFDRIIRKEVYQDSRKGH